MATSDTYLAVFTGSKTSTNRKAWDALTDNERRAKEKEGMDAWTAWMEKFGSAVVYNGGPVGKTKRISRAGIADVTNELAVFLVVRAPSHEAAAKMFEGHPHFTIFPGEAVEVMPVLPVPKK